MKIASLAPQFVIEAPVSAEEAEREAVKNELSDLKMGQTEEVAPSPEQGLEQETRAGLLRLAELLRQQSHKDRQKREAKGARSRIGQTKNSLIHRGLGTYQAVSNGWDGTQDKGQLFKKTG